MGLRFDLRIANWLAHVLDERMPVPKLEREWEEREALGKFLSDLGVRFYSSPEGQTRFSYLLGEAEHRLRHGEPSTPILADLRRYLRDRPWTALLVPSGDNPHMDEFICSKHFLQEIILIRPGDPGLVLQMESPPDRVFSLTDVFPAFRTALASSTDWPGVLLWTQRGDSVFLPVSNGSTAGVMRQANWIFSHLATSLGADLEQLKEQYRREFPEMFSPSSARVTIVHLSDIHLGCREAGVRLPRIQTILTNVIAELGEDGTTVIPLVSGDLMDSPDEDNLDRVRSFLGLLENISTEKPIVLLGNHDVRNDGYLSENLRMAMQIESRSAPVRWSTTNGWELHALIPYVMGS